MSTMHIRLLGHLRVWREEWEITGFHSRKTKLLLAYLALFPHQVHLRDTLSERFWPELTPEKQRANLRIALNNLRQQLKTAEETVTPLLTDRTHVSLTPGLFRTDVAEFDAAFQSAQRIEQESERIPSLEVAADLYQGELLLGYDADWILPERTRLENAILSVVNALTIAHAHARRLDQALVYAHRAVQIDPFREASHRALIQLYLVMQRPVAAREQYQELERLLKVELGTTPSEATRKLVADLIAERRSDSPARVAPVPTTDSTGMSLQNRPGESPISLPSPPPHASHLPPLNTRFFGREEESTLLATLLTPSGSGTSDPTPQDLSTRRSRVVTLVGSPGVGKTRLALEIGHRLCTSYAQRVWFCGLADLEEGERLYERIGTTIGLSPSPPPSLSSISTALSDRPALLILDNFEQLLELPGDSEDGPLSTPKNNASRQAAPLLQALLNRLPTLTCLVTSRQRLDLEGEQEFPVLPLAAPLHPGTPERILEFPGVQLFVDRARSIKVDFEVTAQNAPDVSRICQRLQGIPLALELAAPWVQLLTPRQIADRILDQLDLLQSRRKDLPPRHRTLRAAIDWSYRQLPADLQRFFADLCIFRGGWTLEDAEAVCAEPQVLLKLQELHRRSLITVESIQGEGREEYRYSLLEMLREYAGEIQEEPALIAQRHAEHYFHLTIGVAGVDTVRRETSIARLGPEHANVLAALEWYQTNSEQGEPLLRFIAALRKFWTACGHLQEAREQTERALRHPKCQPPCPGRARALSCLMNVTTLQGDIPATCAWAEECLQVSLQEGDRASQADALNVQGNYHTFSGDRPKGRLYFEESIAIRKEIGEQDLNAMVLLNIGIGYSIDGDHIHAEEYIQQALTLAQHTGYHRAIAAALCELAALRLQQGKADTASALVVEALAIFRHLQDYPAQSRALGRVAQIALDKRDWDSVRSAIQQRLALVQQTGSQLDRVWCLNYTARLAQARGNLVRAARLLAALLRTHQTLNIPIQSAIKAELDKLIQETREELSPETFDRAWRAGEMMEIEQALSYGLQEEEHESPILHS